MDSIFRSMLRGFGWTLGRRAAYRAPLWLAIVVVVALHFLMKGL